MCSNIESILLYTCIENTKFITHIVTKYIKHGEFVFLILINTDIFIEPLHKYVHLG